MDRGWWIITGIGALAAVVGLLFAIAAAEIQYSVVSTCVSVLVALFLASDNRARTIRDRQIDNLEAQRRYDIQLTLQTFYEFTTPIDDALNKLLLMHPRVIALSHRPRNATTHTEIMQLQEDDIMPILSQLRLHFREGDRRLEIPGADWEAEWKRHSDALVSAFGSALAAETQDVQTAGLRAAGVVIEDFVTNRKTAIHEARVEIENAPFT